MATERFPSDGFSAFKLENRIVSVRRFLVVIREIGNGRLTK